MHLIWLLDYRYLYRICLYYYNKFIYFIFLLYLKRKQRNTQQSPKTSWMKIPQKVPELLQTLTQMTPRDTSSPLSSAWPFYWPAWSKDVLSLWNNWKKTNLKMLKMLKFLLSLLWIHVNWWGRIFSVFARHTAFGLLNNFFNIQHCQLYTDLLILSPFLKLLSASPSQLSSMKRGGIIFHEHELTDHLGLQP